MQNSEKVTFRPQRRWRIAGLIVAVAGVVIYTAVQPPPDRNWLNCMTTLFALMVFSGVVESCYGRITLEETKLVYGEAIGRKHISKELIDTVEWGTSYGVSLKLKSGKEVFLPQIGDVEEVGAAIKKWLGR